MLPKHRLQEFVQETFEKIEKNGWIVIGVPQSGGFVYTVGLSFHRLPEIYMDGVAPAGFRSCVDEVHSLAAAAVTGKAQLIPGREWTNPETSLELEIKEMEDTSAMKMAKLFCPEGFTAVKVGAHANHGKTGT